MEQGDREKPSELRFVNTSLLKLSCDNLTFIEKVAFDLAILELFSKGLFISFLFIGGIKSW